MIGLMKALPLFYVTPTVVWVEDNQLFLDAIRKHFKEKYYSMTFQDATQASNFLSSYKPPSQSINFTRELVESDIFDMPNHLPIDINLSEIAKLASNEALKNEIAVLVIDNNMPGINGLEICKQLKNAPFKKILLTGETSSNDVIDAFNQGVIDKFIAKEKNAMDKLEKSVRYLSHQYFFDKTKNLLAHLEISRASPLSDSIFINHFLQWRAENQLEDFYLINKQGSFLLKNKKGNQIFFIVMSESTKEEFIKLNDEAPKTMMALLSQVAKGEKIPFFGIGKESWELGYEEWEPYFYPANVLQGREKYYWTVVASDCSAVSYRN